MILFNGLIVWTCLTALDWIHYIAFLVFGLTVIHVDQFLSQCVAGFEKYPPDFLIYQTHMEIQYFVCICSTFLHHLQCFCFSQKSSWGIQKLLVYPSCVCPPSLGYVHLLALYQLSHAEFVVWTLVSCQAGHARHKIYCKTFTSPKPSVLYFKNFKCTMHVCPCYWNVYQSYRMTLVY